jgi:hypothetical protein
MILKRSTMPTLAASLALLLATPGGAEEWKYDLEVYLLGAGIDGTAGIGPVEAEVDLSFGDVLEELEFGAMGLFRARKGRWAFLGDAIFVGLGTASEVAEVDVDQLILEGIGVYKITDRLGLLFGGRYIDLENEVAFRGPLGLRARGGESWLDPVVGLGVEAPTGGKWTFYGRFDAGGFGVGSDFSYQAKLNFAYRRAERYSLIFGYRLLDIDYDDGTGPDRFLYDVQTSGPNAGIIFHF